MTPSIAVLDTNVVLDWFVFRNPGVTPVVQAIEHGSVRWLCCAEMRAELAHVLANARLGIDTTIAEQALTSVDRHGLWVKLPRPLATVRLRCSDASDQMFVDLALAHRARWLLTRDRALLKLARKAAPLGLLIQRPEAWQPLAAVT